MSLGAGSNMKMIAVGFKGGMRTEGKRIRSILHAGIGLGVLVAGFVDVCFIGLQRWLFRFFRFE